VKVYVVNVADLIT